MNHVGEKIFNLATYGVTFAGIAVNFETIKSVILFIGALILLGLQIYLHFIKIKNEKDAKNKRDN
jgi:hypothetical protein